MTPDTKREVFRKLLHMSMGLFALALRWLTPWQAALCALAAIVHNLWVFPHYGMKKLERPEEKARGYSGMIGYPVIVLVLILLNFAPPIPSSFTYTVLAREDLVFYYRYGLSIVAGAWAILAFGDAFAALAGLLLKGPALPWNAGKRWSGFAGFGVVGSLASFGAMEFFLCEYLSPAGGSRFHSHAVLAFLCALAALAAAAVESLPGQLDDNLTVPLMAWAVLSGLRHLCITSFSSASLHVPAGAVSAHGPQMALVPPGVLFRTHWDTTAVLGTLVAVNVVLGLSALAFRWVDLPACLLGILFGLAVVAGMGSTGYAFLLLFYFLSHFSTYYGKRVKESRGIEEPHGGQRRSGSVFSKGLIPALFALVSPASFFPALAVYTADTVASEVGKSSRGRAFSLLKRREVPPGTIGAVSFAGSAAGLACIAIFCACLLPVLGYFEDQPATGIVSLLVFHFPYDSPLYLLAFSAACVLCFFSESLVNEWNATRGYLSKEVIHLFTGILAGTLVYLPFKLSCWYAYWEAFLRGDLR